MSIVKVPLNSQAAREAWIRRANPTEATPIIDNLTRGMDAEFNSEMYTIAGLRSEGFPERLLLDLLAPDLSHVYRGVPADEVTTPTRTTANIREGLDEGRMTNSEWFRALGKALRADSARPNVYRDGFDYQVGNETVMVSMVHGAGIYRVTAKNMGKGWPPSQPKSKAWSFPGKGDAPHPDPREVAKRIKAARLMESANESLDENFPGMESGSHDPLFDGVMDTLFGEAQDGYTRRALGLSEARPGDMDAAKVLRSIIKKAVGRRVNDLSISWWFDNWSDATIKCSDAEHKKIVAALRGKKIAGRPVDVRRDQGLKTTYIELK